MRKLQKENVKAKFLKLDLNEKNVKMYTDFLKQIKMPFTMEISNYTTKIISTGYNIHFLKQEQSNRVFAAYSKIKSDLKNKILPDINTKRNYYYDTAFKGDGFFADHVINVDIKCAYATILYNDGFIKRKTFLYIKSLPKQDRLTALGMLASRKDIFHHNKNGEIIKSEERISPLSNFFFYCVQKTEFIIQSFKNEFLKDRFLFSWVDGVYHNSSIGAINFDGIVFKNLSDCSTFYFKKYWKLEISIENLTDFDVTLKNDFYKISFKNSAGKRKVFNIPLPESQLKQDIINYLLTKKY